MLTCNWNMLVTFCYYWMALEEDGSSCSSRSCTVATVEMVRRFYRDLQKRCHESCCCCCRHFHFLAGQVAIGMPPKHHHPRRCHSCIAASSYRRGVGDVTPCSIFVEYFSLGGVFYLECRRFQKFSVSLFFLALLSTVWYCLCYIYRGFPFCGRPACRSGFFL